MCARVANICLGAPRLRGDAGEWGEKSSPGELPSASFNKADVIIDRGWVGGFVWRSIAVDLT